jgi:2-amino-4-hydroxy-6-hydroxymethyldihydropteridine diphosphokinase
MVLAIVALGANLAGRFSSPAAAVEAGLGKIDAHAGRVVARSRLYRSTAWPDPDDPEFANAVALVETTCSAEELLTRLHEIETAFGRVRREMNAPRPIDLDIVDFGGAVSIPDDTPILPHPRMAERAFVLLPLQEIVPDWRHPVTGQGLAELVAALPDPGSASPL